MCMYYNKYTQHIHILRKHTFFDVINCDESLDSGYIYAASSVTSK